jgi:hypothetical protein
MHFAYLLFQMAPSGQVIRLTRAEHVPGYPNILCQALSSQGLPWYPEYTVHEEYRDYGQGQFFCQVHILNFEGDQVHYDGAGIGMTVEQSVQEAAYHALTCFRDECRELADEDSPFRYFPRAVDGPEGVYRVIGADASDHPDFMIRWLVEMLNATLHRAHLWREYAVAIRKSHWDTLVDIEPYVEDDSLPQGLLHPTPLEATPLLALLDVGGTNPPRGPLRTPPVIRGVRQSPYGRQPLSAYRFHTPRVLLRPDLRGNY